MARPRGKVTGPTRPTIDGRPGAAIFHQDGTATIRSHDGRRRVHLDADEARRMLSAGVPFRSPFERRN